MPNAENSRAFAAANAVGSQKMAFHRNALQMRGDRHLIVSNGVGNWFPLRTRAPAEIVRLRSLAKRARPASIPP